MAAAIDRHCEIYKWPYLQIAPPIFINFVAKCPSLQPFSSEMKVNLCERIPLTTRKLCKNTENFVFYIFQMENKSYQGMKKLYTLRKIIHQNSPR